MLQEYLRHVVDGRASDLHLKAGSPPAMRVDGELVRIDLAPPTEDEMSRIADGFLSPQQRTRFVENNEVDFAFSLDGVGRFRANFYRHRGAIAMTIRHVRDHIPSIDDLHLPPVIEELAFRPRGLILVTGAVGSGKSTTLAAMIQLINSTAPRKIISIEDPIEYVFSDASGFITQREVGSDTGSYTQGLVHILRQDPDVIFIGEIREVETMSVALTAADTGRLVMSTLHTADAAQTVNRVLSFYPPHQHEQVRVMLAGTLQAAIAQRLVRRADGNGRVPAVEVMIGTGTIRECLLDAKKTGQITNTIAEGVSQYGMQTFDQSLMRLLREGLITEEEALRFASNPHEFSLQISGIEGTSDTVWKSIEDPSSMAQARKATVRSLRRPTS